MKTRSTILFLASLFILASCAQKAEFEPDTNLIEGEDVQYGYSVSFSGEEDGKSVIDNRHLSWESDDLVGVYVNHEASTVCQNLRGDVYTDVSPRMFKFFSTAALEEGDKIYAYAPYSTSAGTSPESVSLTLPEDQYQVVEKVSPNDRFTVKSLFDGIALPMVAAPTQVSVDAAVNDKANATTHFCNLASLLCFKVYSDKNGVHKYSGDMSRYYGKSWNVWNYVNSVTFTLTSGSGLSGTGTIDLTALSADPKEGELELSGADGTSVTVHTGVRVTDTKDEAAAIYMAILPGTWSGTLTFTTTVGDFHFTLTNVTFERSKLKTYNVNLDNDPNAPEPPTDNSGYGTERSFTTVRSKLSAAGTYTFSDSDGANIRIYGVVIGDCDNPNMDQNLQYGTTVDGYAVTTIDKSASGEAPDALHIYTTENDRTNYLQGPDGDLGFRLKFKNPRQNIYKRGDKLFIWLKGVKLIREDNPTRYTLALDENVKIILFDRWMESTLIHSDHSPHYANPVSIGDLTDDMIYTNVRIKNLEFQQDRRCYANVREYDAIANPINKGLREGNPYSCHSYHAKDGAVNLLYDGSGKGIYMLMNMNCDWRWNPDTRMRKKVPTGKGTIGGVLVHQEMERWGGNIGDYSIRPLQEADIDFKESSAWTTLVEWTLTKNTVGVGAYSWNNNTGAGGYETKAYASEGVLTQNKLNADESTGMINKTGGRAQLYIETTKPWASSYGASNWFVQPGYNSSGENVTDYTTYLIKDGSHNITGTTVDNPHPFGLLATALEFFFDIEDCYDDSHNPTKGIVAEFSTSGKSFTDASIGFAACGGLHNRTNAAASWLRSATYPIEWKVQWSTYNGSSWSAWSSTGVTNVATNENAFDLRSVPFCANAGATRESLYDDSEAGPFFTHSCWGFGMVPYRFTLPGASLSNKSKVRVRLIPRSIKMAKWNRGAMDSNLWYSASCSVDIPFTGYTIEDYSGVCLEDVKIQYK
ncbi:MAG: hypothetical protein IJU13_04610 [Bacteroidales bacterium]|nr:hypothetical protein [Bacteroidales bacterium]